MSYTMEAICDVVDAATRAGGLETDAPEVVGAEIAVVTRYADGSYQVWLMDSRRGEWTPGPMFKS